MEFYLADMIFFVFGIITSLILLGTSSILDICGYSKPITDAVQLFAFIIGIMLSVGIATWTLRHDYFVYYGAVGTVSATILHCKIGRRWQWSDKQIMFMGSLWPMTILFSPWIIHGNEQKYKLRIIQEIMEE
jgi:hypothetical protein